AANKYLAMDGTATVCQERFRFTLLVRETGYLVLWESTFSMAGKEVIFGDQEEMGLGIRVATPLAVDNGGRIVDSMGRLDGKEVWGRQSNWCDYHGQIGNHLLGVTLMPHPDNFRPSWFHARDYGLVVANPFGRTAFTKQEKSRVVVPAKEPLRLRFAIHLHSQLWPAGAVLPTAEKMGRQRERAYQDYLKILHSGGGVR
ncbi:MAG: PmoA family protein, partial [Pirellulaceae bacterium]|nr:PmoA family protein [Pirellulaceae bacterium]